jgi:hypothetical protein
MSVRCDWLMQYAALVFPNATEKALKNGVVARLVGCCLVVESVAAGAVRSSSLTGPTSRWGVLCGASTCTWRR